MSRISRNFVAGLLAMCAAAGPARAETVTVFAAVSLTDAVSELTQAYRGKTGKEVRLSFASSSTLARQIEAGAPADIFASANEEWMDYLAQKGLVVESTRMSPIGNSVVLIAPEDSPVAPVTPSPALDLAALLGPDGRLAVGDPAHVPAGQYARQALESLGLWASAEPRLARADNVRAALALVERGEAPLGIVYGTDARAAKVTVLGRFPPGSHPPVSYPFARLRPGAAPEAEVEALFAFITGAEGLAIFERYGFVRD